MNKAKEIKIPKVVGCLLCGFRSENVIEIKSFQIEGCPNCDKEELPQKLCGACCQYFGQNEADPQGWHSPEFCDLAPICQLCGGKILDIEAGAVVLPWGDTCGECMKEIQTTTKGNK
jgi:hypothetical protein